MTRAATCMTDCASHPLLSSPDPAAAARVVRQGREGNSYSLVIMATGVVVMLIVLAILMPIIEMIQLIRP